MIWEGHARKKKLKGSSWQEKQTDNKERAKSTIPEIQVSSRQQE